MNNMETLQLIFQIDERLAQLRQDVERRLNFHAEEISRLDNIIQAATTTAVHELIDYLRHDDIQSLDEEEFSRKIRDLLWDESTALPF